MRRTIISGARDVTAVSPLAGRSPYYVTLASEMRSVRERAPAAPHAAAAARRAAPATLSFSLFFLKLFIMLVANDTGPSYKKFTDLQIRPAEPHHREPRVHAA